jgi:hypothetical protein
VSPFIGTEASEMRPLTTKLESLFTGSFWKLYCDEA